MEFDFLSAEEVRKTIEKKEQVRQKQALQADKIKAAIAKMLEEESYKEAVNIKFEELDKEVKENLEAKGYYLYKNAFGDLLVSVIKLI